MQEHEQAMLETQKRIVEEVTFLADHILRMEKLLRQILYQLDNHKKVPLEPFSIP